MYLQKDELKQDGALLTPQERVSAVRPMWEQRGHSDRVALLTVELNSLKQQAQQQADKARASAGVHMLKAQWRSSRCSGWQGPTAHPNVIRPSHSSRWLLLGCNGHSTARGRALCLPVHTIQQLQLQYQCRLHSAETCIGQLWFSLLDTWQ
jgi:hypothetical protein